MIEGALILLCVFVVAGCGFVCGRDTSQAERCRLRAKIARLDHAIKTLTERERL
jgi:hypothetical protein